MGRQWADDDGVEVIDVHNKDLLHIFEGPVMKSTSEVCVHGLGRGVGESGKTKHILDYTGFMGGKHMIDLGTGKNNISVLVAC